MKRRYDKGTTLLELLVYAALLILVFTGIFGIFIASVKYYNSANASIKVQQSALEATYRLTRELSESSLSSVVLYNGTPKGIVFMSPRTTTGTVSHNSTSGFEGEVTWNSYVCYYLETDAEDSTKFQLVRKVKGVAASDEPTASALYTAAYFSSGSGASIKGQVLAHRIETLSFYWLSGATPSYAGTPTANPVYVSLTTKQANASNNEESVQTLDTIWVGN